MTTMRRLTVRDADTGEQIFAGSIPRRFSFILMDRDLSREIAQRCGISGPASWHAPPNSQSVEILAPSLFKKTFRFSVQPLRQGSDGVWRSDEAAERRLVAVECTQY